MNPGMIYPYIRVLQVLITGNKGVLYRVFLPVLRALFTPTHLSYCESPPWTRQLRDTSAAGGIRAN